MLTGDQIDQIGLIEKMLLPGVAAGQKEEKS